MRKATGLIVDYNGMLRSLREALAQYALGDEGAGQEEIVAPIEDEDSVTLGICEHSKHNLTTKVFYSAIQSCRHRISRKRGQRFNCGTFQGNGAVPRG